MTSKHLTVFNPKEMDFCSHFLHLPRCNVDMLLFQIEIHVGEYLRKNEEETVQAVSLYLDALLAVGIAWYNGEYPLVLMDNLVYQWIKVSQ